MAKFQLIRTIPLSKPARMAQGVQKNAFSMLTAEGVYSDGTTQFVCTLPPWFEFKDELGNVQTPLPVLKIGAVYDLVARWSPERSGKNKGELRFDIDLVPVSQVKAA